MEMIGLGIAGASGRMGQEIEECLEKDQRFILRERRSSSLEDAFSFFENVEAVIDFSTPQGTLENLEACLRAPRPLVIGTTNLEENHFQMMKKASQKVPVFYSPNMSLGISLLQKMIKELTRALGDQFDIEITEAHHRHKADAPSGTALFLGDAAAGARGHKLSEIKRNSCVNEIRPKGSIGFSSVRGGALPGEHSIHWISDDEQITFSHKAFSRRLFAQGALNIMKWLVKQPCGLYTMDHYLEKFL